MNKELLFFLIVLLTFNNVSSQVGIGTVTPNASAALDIVSNNKGFLPPRMTSEDRDNIISPANGLTIFNTTVNCIQFFTSGYWYDLCLGSYLVDAVSNCTSKFEPPYLTGKQTTIVEITNPTTGRTWMDRNLGAATAARSANDCYAFGNLYQWGRTSDGHDFRESATAAGPVASGTEGSDFITNGTSPQDWLNVKDSFRWNSSNNPNAVTKTINDPCPNGFRVPTEAELVAEYNSWSSQDQAGAFASPLKIQLAGNRNDNNGVVANANSRGRYWTSSAATQNSRFMQISNSQIQMVNGSRASGYSVRCIKE